MRVYHEHLRVPASWWPFGLVLVVLLSAETVAGLPWAASAAISLGLLAALVLVLVLSGRTAVEVRDRELRVGQARLRLDCAGEVTALAEDQTRLLRGPRADPQAFLLTRPYLKRAVYIQIPGSCPAGAEQVPAGGHRLRAVLRGALRQLPGGWAAGLAARLAADLAPARHPYWLVGSRQPEQLAAAIEKSRPAARPGGVPVG